MAINLAIDVALLEDALRLSGYVTKKAPINEALHEYVLRRKQGEVIKLFGKIDVDTDYEYKPQRRRK